MTVFAESPWPALLLFGAIEIAFGIVFLRTGRAIVVVGMVLALAVAIGLVVYEQSIVTDIEQVEDTLHGIAEDLEANDQAAVLSAFLTTCPALPRVRSALADVTVSSASVGRDLEVRINELTIPPSATAFFTGRINARENRGQSIPYENFIRKFKIKLEQHGDRWLIADVEDADFRSRN
jgi:hypothetical protein